MTVDEGFSEVHVFQWPPVPEAPGCYALVLMKREGGFLLALPTGFLSAEVLTAAREDAASPLGPYTILTVSAVTEEGDTHIPMGFDMDVLVVDVQAEVLNSLVLLGQSNLQEDALSPFFVDPAVIPDSSHALRLAKEWIMVSGEMTAGFYSAEEEVVPQAKGGPLPSGAGSKKAPAPKPKKMSGPQLVAENIKMLAELVPSLAGQISAIQEEQVRMRADWEAQASKPPIRPSQVPVSMDMQALGKVIGAPPRTKQLNLPAPPAKKASPTLTTVEQIEEFEKGEEVAETAVPAASGDALALAVLEQSRALTTLVSQLQSGDPLLDAQAGAFSTSSKGAQGREKLQGELSSRSGNFMLSVMQNAMRRMRPASPLPTSLAQVAQADFSMVNYLERYGGYGNCRELGMIMFALSFIADAAVREDMAGVQEHVALLMVAIEQACQDQGRWDLAFQLLLLDDPPAQLWSYNRSGNPMSTGRARAFAPLCPQRWATVSLAFLKELDFIQNRRTEMGKKAQPAQAPDTLHPSPKKKRFPKTRGQGGGDGSNAEAASSSGA